MEELNEGKTGVRMTNRRLIGLEKDDESLNQDNFNDFPGGHLFLAHCKGVHLDKRYQRLF
jgi:hypothetical protein